MGEEREESGMVQRPPNQVYIAAWLDPIQWPETTDTHFCCCLHSSLSSSMIRYLSNQNRQGEKMVIFCVHKTTRAVQQSIFTVLKHALQNSYGLSSCRVSKNSLQINDNSREKYWPAFKIFLTEIGNASVTSLWFMLMCLQHHFYDMSISLTISHTGLELLVL